MARHNKPKIIRPKKKLWRKALELAEGDPHRILVISETEAVVYNN